MPAPFKNRNATRHGLRAGMLPKGAAYIRRDTESLRRVIEDAVVEVGDGNVSLYQAALVQSTIRWERHAMLCQRWLRLEASELGPNERMAFSRDIARASTERDKCLRELGLDKRASDNMWATLDRTPTLLADDTDRTNGRDDASAGVTRDDSNVSDAEDPDSQSCDTSDSEQPASASPEEG